MSLRRRQIHLDFHTAAEISDVGRDFDAQAFAATLHAAHVDSVTCFAKCHHGLFYYPSKVGPQHPSLTFDLLGAMVEACHEKDILVPAYISVQFDQHAARTHPEWRVVEPDGRLSGPLVGDAPGAGWPTLCTCTGYRAYLADTVRELLAGYAVDGVFFDICADRVSCSEAALAKMRECGLDPADAGDRQRFARQESVALLSEFSSLVHELRPGLPVFFNGRIDLPMRDSLPYLTHLEVESLPTGGWGYDHFQRLGRYVRTLGKPFLGMTARFHKSWADFGTLKNDAALEYEVLLPVVHGGGASIGDQLHPRGALEPPVYQQIGRVYGKVRELEPYLKQARPLTQIGVLSALTRAGAERDEALASDRGAVAMLNETHQLFDLLDLDAELSAYEVIVLPDAIAPEPALASRLDAFVGQGGRVLVTGRSLLDEVGRRFAWESLGVTYAGPLEHCPFYVRPHGGVYDELAGMDHCVYEPGVRVTAARPEEVLAGVVAPYFNRTAEHYCSHFQTPPDRPTGDPAVVVSDRTAYLNAPVFRAYARHGNRVYRDLVQACLEHLLPDRLLRTSLPSTAQVSVLDQRNGGRWRRTVHVLHYPALRRAEGLDIIEDRLPLHDVAIELVCPGEVESVELVPGKTPIAFQQAVGRVRFVVPEVIGHAAVCVTID